MKYNPILNCLTNQSGKRPVSRGRSLPAAAAFVLAFSPTLHAANIWDGGGTPDGNWNTPANWDDNVVPASGTLTFSGNLQNSTINDLPAGTLFTSISFANDGSAGKTNGFTLAGSSINIGPNITTTANTTASTISDIIDLNLVLTTGHTITVAQVSSTQLHPLRINGIISETGGAFLLQKEGEGQLILTNPANSFSGQLRVNRGQLNTNSIANSGVNCPIGKGNSIRLGNNTSTGHLNVTAGATSTDRPVTIGNGSASTETGGATISNNTSNGAGALIFTRTPNFNTLNATSTAPRTLTLSGGNTDANEIQGIIADNNTAGGGTIAVSKSGQGNWKLSNNGNSFTGNITTVQGPLTVTSIGNIGVASAAGAGSQITLGSNTLSQGPLIYTGSGNSTNRTIVVAAKDTSVIHQNGANGGTGLIFTGTFTVTGTEAKALQLNGTNTDANEIQSLISDGTSSALTVNKTNGGTWTLSNNGNSFSGPLQINAGTLNATSIANGGVNSAIGKGTTIRIGNSTSTATLNFAAGAASTDRQVQIGEGTGGGGATINNNTANGAGTLVFANPAFNFLNAAATAARTLTLGGANTDANEIQGVIADNNVTGGTVGVTKAGTGTWKLSGVNTYTGATTVNGGMLALGATGSITTSSSVILGAAGTLNTSAIATYVVPTAQPVTFNIDPTGSGTSGKITAAGLDITNAVVTLNPTAALDDPLYVLATYTGTLGGSSFAAPLPTVPSGYTLNYAYEGNKIALVQNAGFSSWITGTFANGPVALDKRGPNDDPDNDGIRNLVEYAIASQDPTVANASIGSITGTSLSYNKRLPLATDITYAIVESTDLGIVDTWAEVSGGSYVNDGTTISYTFTPGTPAKDFFRLQVTQNTP